MKTITNNVEKMLNENKIKYFKGKDVDIYNIPYRGIKNPNNHVFIYLTIDNDLDIVIISILEKANKNRDLFEIKSQLLDLNADIQFGTLSMRNNSDSIEFVIKQQLGSFSFEDYKTSIIQCVNIYEKLKAESII